MTTFSFKESRLGYRTQGSLRLWPRALFLHVCIPACASLSSSGYSGCFCRSSIWQRRPSSKTAPSEPRYAQRVHSIRKFVAPPRFEVASHRRRLALTHEIGIEVFFIQLRLLMLSCSLCFIFIYGAIRSCLCCIFPSNPVRRSNPFFSPHSRIVSHVPLAASMAARRRTSSSQRCTSWTEQRAYGARCSRPCRR